MKFYYSKILVLTIMISSLFLVSYADLPGELVDDHPLFHVAYKLGQIQEKIRKMSDSYNENGITKKDCLNQFSFIFKIFNYACAQEYVLHLKQLREGNLSDKNVYTHHKPNENHSVISYWIGEGNMDYLKNNANIIHSLDEIKSMLCQLLESSYRDLFNITDFTENQTYPYHEKGFCKPVENVTVKEEPITKEDL